MAKADFTKNAVYSHISEVTQDKKDRKTYTEAEKLEVQESGKTSGRKGCGLPRINLAVLPSNHEYVECMAQVTGTTKTDFINQCIAEHRENHREIYDKAMEFRRLLGQ